MNNFEILKVVRRTNTTYYRSVLDKSVVDDINCYSYWGISRLLHDINNAINWRLSSFLDSIKIDQNVKTRGPAGFYAQILNNKTFHLKWGMSNFEMPAEEFFKFYDEYMQLVEKKAHEIILRKIDNKLSVEGIWYKDDSPFNINKEKEIYILAFDLNMCLYDRVGVDRYKDLITDIDSAINHNYDTLCFLITGCYEGVSIGRGDVHSEEFKLAYYNHIKTNASQLIGEAIFTHEGYHVILKSENTLAITDEFDYESEDTTIFEMDLDEFFYIYIETTRAKNELPDEVIFTKENGKLKIEGSMHDDGGEFHKKKIKAINDRWQKSGLL